MLIGEFARRSGLSQDTVRFYIRKGLFTPRLGHRGGRHPYQQFDARDVSVARMIRFAQSLGMSLKEIGDITRELQADALSPEREVELLDMQATRLERKAQEIAALTDYLRAKRDWIARGRAGDEPQLKASVGSESDMVEI